ncbi:MAG: RIP metalloprotease RseP [Bacteroidota bacterium]|nr:RIP metalloprotease RseP [Bacteroidota bacterium]
MGILTQALGLILSLSILVILHEAGHFVVARIFNTRIEKFYLFFNPWFELFKIKKGDTEYGIGWLPLGGYVKISGMIDESMDREQMKQPPQPWEFRSKPAWQRLLIMTGGVIVNFILALFIYSMMLFAWGKEYLPAENVKYGYEFHEVAQNIGLQNGDKILMVDAFTIDDYADIVPTILLEDVSNITIERNGRKMQIGIPEGFVKEVIGKEVRGLISLRVPFVVDTILPDKPGYEARFRKNDRILAVNDVPTKFYSAFEKEKQKHKDEQIEVLVKRNNIEKTLYVKLGEDGMIGIGNKSLAYYFDMKKTKYSFLASIPAGITLGVETLIFYVKQMKLVFTKEGATQLGGFGAIGSLFPKTWDWRVFWNMTAFISLVLAFMNILPIPALDGGHVAFLLFEIVTGRKPSDKFLEYAQIVGMVLLVALLLFANGNDIYRGWVKE